MASSGACDYCGLPLAADPSASNELAEPSVPLYCCYGCRFAARVTHASGDNAQARWLMTRLGLSVFCTMHVMVFTLVLWSHDGNSAEPAAGAYYSVARYLCLLFATPVMLMLAGTLIEAAWFELHARRPSLHLLLVAGVLAAYGYSVASVVRGGGHVYFEVSCMVLVFVTLGRWLEASGKLQTTAALRALERLLPDQVRLIRDGVAVLVPRDQLEPGQLIRVLAGERIPADGRIDRNRASVDQQVVTGESLPVVKEPGDAVFAGTLNLDGDLWIVATSRADAGLISRLIDAVTRTATDREPYQRIAARISHRFVPLVAMIASATFAWHAWRSGWEPALLASLSVVVIACPCALGLATPMALWAAMGRAAQARILIQEGDALSRLAAADAIFFDKTGTLSTGQAQLRDFLVAGSSPRNLVVSTARSLAATSNHPLAQALLAGLTATAIETTVAADEPQAANEVVTLAGRGVRAIPVELGEPAWLGSRRLMDETHQDLGQLSASLDQLDSGDIAPAPQCFLGWGGQVRAIATFDERFRMQAAETLAWFRDRLWQVAVLTGDRRIRAEQLERAWNTPVRSELLPDEKLAAIQEARRTGRRVVMVGDGINDAPALAAADIGIALGCGADVSRQSAAVCLLSDDLRQLPWLITLAQRTAATVRWNLIWTFAYNVIGIGIAVLGWLNPVIAAIAMVASSLMVVSNSLCLGQLPLPTENSIALDDPGEPAERSSPAPGSANQRPATAAGEMRIRLGGTTSRAKVAS